MAFHNSYNDNREKVQLSKGHHICLVAGKQENFGPIPEESQYLKSLTFASYLRFEFCKYF